MVDSSTVSFSLTNSRRLMDITLVKESNEVFITKLALSFGRSASFYQ